MTIRQVLNITGIIMISMIIMLAGCSDNNTEIVTKWDGSIEPENTISSFFPLTENYMTAYSIEQSSGSTELVSYQIGAVVPFGEGVAHQWISVDGNQNVDTSFLVVTSDALIYYRDRDVAGETILALPLIPGKSWERNSDVISGSYGDDFGDDLATNFDPPDDTFDDNWVYAKDLPISGDATMTVKTVESLQLSNGNSYPQSYLISNKVGTDNYNYYWYVPGVGLTKFVIGGSFTDHENGDLIGELVEYGNLSN